MAQTGYLTAGVLVLCHIILMISQKRMPWLGIGMLIVSAVLLFSSRNTQAIYTHDSPYQHIEIREQTYNNQPVRTMILDGGFASSWDPIGQRSVFGYIRYSVETADLRNKLSAVAGQKKLLVIGAA
ncbi:hypothetical protein KBC03_00680 [Patescibacteria group bacterium]|nr:hypothetical protein [Patescibacteria group bacterium]